MVYWLGRGLGVYVAVVSRYVVSGKTSLGRVVGMSKGMYVCIHLYGWPFMDIQFPPLGY